MAPSTGTISTIAGSGVAGFTGDNGSALAAQLSEPAAVSVSAGGSIYIADTLNRRIRVIKPCGAVAPPLLTFPTDGAAGVAAAAALKWTAVALADRYEVLLDTVNPPRVVVASSLSSPGYASANLAPGTTYYWSVVARTDAFCPSPSTASSQVRMFSTTAGCRPSVVE